MGARPPPGHPVRQDVQVDPVGDLQAGVLAQSPGSGSPAPGRCPSPGQLLGDGDVQRHGEVAIAGHAEPGTFSAVISTSSRPPPRAPVQRQMHPAFGSSWAMPAWSSPLMAAAGRFHLLPSRLPNF